MKTTMAIPRLDVQLVSNRSACPAERCGTKVTPNKITFLYPWLMCWIQGRTCDQYKSLPADEQSPEDRLAIKLAKVFDIIVL